MEFSPKNKMTISKTGKKYSSTTVMDLATKEAENNLCNTRILNSISEGIISLLKNSKIYKKESDFLLRHLKLFSQENQLVDLLCIHGQIT